MDLMGVDLVKDPDYVIRNPLETAAGYFATHKIWEKCDKGSDETTVENVTGAVNKGKLAIQERKDKFKYFFNLLVPKA